MQGDDVIVELRDVTEDDLPILFEYQLDLEAVAMAAVPARDREGFIDHWTNRVLGDPTVIARAVVADGHVVGDIVSFNRGGVREVGYWIGRPFWGKGVATRALAAFLEADPHRPLVGRVAATNVASIRVLEKCGFTVVEDEADMPEPLGDGVEEIVLRFGAPA
jgi:RimJ/RimL family protein N-acetyltransferase